MPARTRSIPARNCRDPAAAKAVGGGSLFALAPGKGIQAHRERGDTLHAYVALTRPPEWFAGIGFAGPASAIARVAREFDGWHRSSPR